MDATLLGEVIDLLHTTTTITTTTPPPPLHPTTTTTTTTPPPPPPPTTTTTEKTESGGGGVVVGVKEVADYLLALTETGRFSLNKRFLSSSQVGKVEVMIERMMMTPLPSSSLSRGGGGGVEDEVVERLKAAYA